MRVGREGSQGLQGGVKGAGTARGWNVTGFHVHHVACSTGAMIGDQGGEVLGSGQAVCQRGMVDQGDDPEVSHAPPPPPVFAPRSFGRGGGGSCLLFLPAGALLKA
jgi:hypothetical protein